MTKFQRVFPLLFLSLLCVAVTGCDEESPGFGLDDGNQDSDTGEESSALCNDGCAEITWGNTLETGAQIGNWSQSGYIDGDCDGLAEQEDTSFSLQDINCDGWQSLVVIISSTL